MSQDDNDAAFFSEATQEYLKKFGLKPNETQKTSLTDLIKSMMGNGQDQGKGS